MSAAVSGSAAVSSAAVPSLSSDLTAALASAGLSSLAGRFAAQEITTVGLFEQLSSADFATLGLTIGKRIVLQDAVAKLRARPLVSPVSSPLPPPPPSSPRPSLPPLPLPLPVQLYEPDPTLAPLRSPLSLPTRAALLALPAPYNSTYNPYGRRLRSRDYLNLLVQKRPLAPDTDKRKGNRKVWWSNPRKRCPRVAFEMKALDGVGAVGARCVAALIQAAALGLPNTRCVSVRSGAKLTALWQLLPASPAPPTLAPIPESAHGLHPPPAPAPAALAGPHYCHRTGTFPDNIASIEQGHMVEEAAESRSRSIGSDLWWSVMQCWRVDGWRWLDAALTDGEGDRAADAPCVFQISSLTGAYDFQPWCKGKNGEQCPLKKKLKSASWRGGNETRVKALSISGGGGGGGSGGSGGGRALAQELISVEFHMAYKRAAARERLRQLRRFLIPRLNSTRCGYDRSTGKVSNVAWHLRAGDLCDSNRTMQTSHFDSAYDAMRRLASHAGGVGGGGGGGGGSSSSSSSAVAIHIFSEAEPLPTASASMLPCLGPRLRLRGCLALDAASGVCTVFRAALDGATAGPLSTIRVLVNGEPFGTLACMAAADRILVAIPSSFSNLAVMISPEAVPVEFGDVWWRRCMLNRQGQGGLLYTRLTRCTTLRLLVWTEPERYAQLNGAGELNNDFFELPPEPGILVRQRAKREREARKRLRASLSARARERKQAREQRASLPSRPARLVGSINQSKAHC